MPRGSGFGAFFQNFMKKTFSNKAKTYLHPVATKFQGSFFNPDKEKLINQGITSPELSDMPFRVKEGKTTRFFATEAKYKNYLKKQIQ
jgi:hypothetical protein